MQPSGIERTFGEDEIIVSKTDLKGRITYANQVFLRVSGYTEQEILGKPHNIIRHPAMPRCIFKMLWDTVQNKREIFAYVLNLASTGEHYWVFAHVTPTFGTDGAVIGYHSNRRSPDRSAVKGIASLYDALLAEEAKHPSKHESMAASGRMLASILMEKKMEYDEFVFSL